MRLKVKIKCVRGEVTEFKAFKAEIKYLTKIKKSTV